MSRRKSPTSRTNGSTLDGKLVLVLLDNKRPPSLKGGRNLWALHDPLTYRPGDRPAKLGPPVSDEVTPAKCVVARQTLKEAEMAANVADARWAQLIAATHAAKVSAGVR